MQSKDGKRFTGKKSAMVVLSLCLVGAAAVSTYYDGFIKGSGRGRVHGGSE